ncbi:hypothetical protein [Azospirillum melinis]
MMTKPAGIPIGDRYARGSTPRHVYVVTSLVDKPGHPLHVRLSAEDNVLGNEILVGAFALLDTAIWKRV